MAYTNRAGKNIIQAWGKVKAPLYATVSAGDLLAYDSTNYGYKAAVEASSLPAIMVACEDGVSGDIIYVASAVEFETTPTESAGVWTAVTLAAAADIGKALYQSTAGIASDTAGTTMAQYVGHILSTTRAMLMPQQSLTGSSATYTGNVAVTGAITGASTLTVALAGTFSSALTVARTLTCSSSIAVTVAASCSTLTAQVIASCSTITAQVVTGTSTISVQTVTCSSAASASTLNVQTIAATSAIGCSTLTVQVIASCSTITAQVVTGTSTISVQAIALSSAFVQGTSAIGANFTHWGSTGGSSTLGYTLRWIATSLQLRGSTAEATVSCFGSYSVDGTTGKSGTVVISTGNTTTMTFTHGILTNIS